MLFSNLPEADCSMTIFTLSVGWLVGCCHHYFYLQLRNRSEPIIYLKKVYDVDQTLHSLLCLVFTAFFVTPSVRQHMSPKQCLKLISKSQISVYEGGGTL